MWGIAWKLVKTVWCWASFLGREVLERTLGPERRYRDATKCPDVPAAPADLYDGEPWRFCGITEQGVYVRRGDHPPMCLPFGAMLAATSGLAHPEGLKYFDPKDHDRVTETFSQATILLETQALSWT